MNRDHDHAMQNRFLEAYEEHADSIYRYGFYRLSDGEAARDLVQDTFLRYWDALAKGTPVASERAFIFTIARRLVIDRYRAKKSESLDKLADETGFEPTDERTPSPERFAEQTHILEVLDRLPESYREVLFLRYVEGFEPREIAQALGESANVVTVRLHRGVAKLRALLHEV